MSEISHPVASHHLEVIDKGRSTAEHPAPLLFVHGAWHAAWCWDEYFLDFFADRGYRALAVSLRGHGNSSAPTPLSSCSVRDYVSDVASVAASLDTAPVVLGHSMGGFVVQKYLESHDAPAGVLLGSAPPKGARSFVVRLFTRYPRLMVKVTFTGSSLALLNSAGFAKDNFYNAETAEADIARWVARLGEESRRISVDSFLLDRPKPALVTAPMLVLGTEPDHCVSGTELRATARAYRTEPEVFPGMGHNMMLVPGWATVAERIDAWLGDHGL
jgi:pimeloyl-ACP methyl ester carboxylesterase